MAETCPDCRRPKATLDMDSHEFYEQLDSHCHTERTGHSAAFAADDCLALAYPRLKAQAERDAQTITAAHACIEAADKMRPWSAASDNCDEAYDSARAHYDRVRATPASTDAKPGQE